MHVLGETSKFLTTGCSQYATKYNLYICLAITENQCLYGKTLGLLSEVHDVDFPMCIM